ncbi:MAG: hypothetical protein IT319_19620 [Anaerolineae bacterium]|nr:hypothetical protein [Anaerolineae bacterium]
MFRVRIIGIVALAALLAAGCSSLPGLRVLTGQQSDQVLSDAAVQSLDLVMADKSGDTDAGLTAAANRIEAADTMIDIIEVRKDTETRVFAVNMLFNPPQSDTSTLDGQIAQYEALRRAFEVTWQGMMPVSEGTDTIQIQLLGAGNIATLDHGESFVGYLVAQGTIERSAAASYLAGARNLNNFVDMVVNGTLDYQTTNQFVPYQGTPNHPMFMLPSSSQ